MQKGLQSRRFETEASGLKPMPFNVFEEVRP